MGELMWPYRGRRGNYSYACARVRAKKSLLLTKDNYPKFLLMDLNEIGRFLGETQYQTEMSELASRWDGVNLIELGTSKNLARIYTEILGFTKGDLHDLIASYLGRWDAWNVKTLLRGKYYGASMEEIREDLVPAGKLKEDDLNVLLSLGSVTEILDALRKKGFEFSDELRATLEKSGSLAPLEDYLDRLFYEKMLAAVGGRTKPEKLFLGYIRREIDTVNLMTLLKMKKEGMGADKILTYHITGGQELEEKEFARLAALEGLDQVVSELAKFHFYGAIKDALEKMKVSGSLTEVSLALQRYGLQVAEKFSHVYPLSVLPIIDYMIRKKIEVDNIRVIARGKESGLDPELIKKLLVI